MKAKIMVYHKTDLQNIFSTLLEAVAPTFRPRDCSVQVLRGHGLEPRG